VDFVIIMVIMGTMGINLVKLFTPAAGIKDNAWREFSNKGIFSRDYQSFFFTNNSLDTVKSKLKNMRIY
jgi:hypothetical protein